MSPEPLTFHPASTGLAAGAAFDRLAATYDHDFTDSVIGRAQRNAVWETLLSVFRPGDDLLELNCGTGEDAFFLARHGLSIFSCDASQQMIARAEQRLALTRANLPIVFCHLPTERLAELDPTKRFNGVFSNFSGLNCIQDLAAVAFSLAKLVNTGDALVLCFSTRICLAEIAYYLLRGQPAKAFRRCKGFSHATLNGVQLPIYYPGLREITRSFAPFFQLQALKGVGVAIPPSYLEAHARRHPVLFRLLCWLERPLAALPLLRTTGDHLLLTFKKVTP